ncbi:MAG: hypothetical protein CL959_01710 [Euryarchaeota archaeon]|nr:hypothetical protein [Euryarchaeota archaeon]|tara:strand:+ start:375 stop:998 length:624 start_codon:yes stop_codon:yes gene_type:complete
MKYDPVNQPSHYTQGREFETIDVIEDWGLDFHLGNAVKYISRAGRKDPEKLNQDISKAIWYLERFQDKNKADNRKKLDLEQFNDQGTYSVLRDSEQEEIEFKAMQDIPNSIIFGVDDSIYASEPAPFDGAEDVLTFTASSYGKDLSKFNDDDTIVSTFIDGDYMLGKQKNGNVRIVGTADGSRLYNDVLKSDPRDLSPSEYEPMHDA